MKGCNVAHRGLRPELVIALDTVNLHVSHLMGTLGPSTAPRPSPGPARAFP